MQVASITQLWKLCAPSSISLTFFSIFFLFPVNEEMPGGFSYDFSMSEDPHGRFCFSVYKLLSVLSKSVLSADVLSASRKLRIISQSIFKNCSDPSKVAGKEMETTDLDTLICKPFSDRDSQVSQGCKDLFCKVVNHILSPHEGGCILKSPFSHNYKLLQQLFRRYNLNIALSLYIFQSQSLQY